MRQPELRLPDWPERLAAVVAWHRRHDFAWGRFDCGTLFSDAATAVTGDDPLGGFTWTNEREALRFLVTHKAPSMIEFVARGFDEIVPSDARRGDVGWTELTGPLVCPAIITGAEAVSRDQNGWIVIPREQITRAFKVGR